MRNGARIGVVIPAFNEERSIGQVLDAIPKWTDQVIVADNASTDDTARVAADHGAETVFEGRRGYGAACLRGIAALDPCNVVVFVDADFSDYPEQMDRLVDPIVNDETDLVIGSRRLGTAERGALTPQQRFGNALACMLIRWFWGVRYTDLGPFRAIRSTTLQAMAMHDRSYGWTVEMQVKAASGRVRTREVAVDYRRRIGTSKISGTLRGVAAAGTKILGTIFSAAARDLIHRSRRRVRRRLIVFSRYPEPGETKTRMIPALGAAGAADLQRAMTEHCVQNARSIMGVEIEVRYAGGDKGRMENWLGPGVGYADQGEGDLGARLRRAFESSFADGIAETVIIGTDCPDLSPSVLRNAFESLRRRGLVLGPATDGGYYLIGLDAGISETALPGIFDGIPWGSDSVFAETVARAGAQAIPVMPLVPLHDVDRPEDFEVWERAKPGAKRPAVSIIIPALNEESGLPSLVDPLQSVPGIEVIVVDGGSTDGTVEVARSLGARVVETGRGRAMQMNTGAAFASGEAFLFQHADTILPQGFEAEIERILSDRRVALGAFRFATNDPRFSMRCIAFFTNIRSRWFQLPYGDQGFFLKRDTFRGLGGFPELPIMEDFVFVRRAARSGRIRTSSLPAVTSARRWQRLGPWRTMLYNQLVIAGYWLGIKPEKLAAFHGRAGSPAAQ